MALSIRAKTLNLVNKIRKAFGSKSLMKMPKGIPEKVLSCPIANAIPVNVRVDGETLAFSSYAAALKAADALWGKGEGKDYISDHFWTKKARWVVESPEAMGEFVTNFDGKMYPDLIK